VRFLGRVLIVLFGLLLAVPTGLLALVIGIVIEPAAQDLLGALGLAGFQAVHAEIWRGGAPDSAAADLLVGAWAVSTAILVVPPALVALVGEAIGTRSFVWYSFGCGALTAALPWLSRGSGPLREGNPALGAEGRLTALLFLSGAAAGLMYWLVAGRSAGRKPSPV
jgi:hypothetical protein